jgi:ribosomal protein L12E/L44/L45/RPP1/RPP2
LHLKARALKPVFHFIGSRVETRRFQAMCQLNINNLYSPTSGAAAAAAAAVVVERRREEEDEDEEEALMVVGALKMFCRFCC